MGEFFFSPCDVVLGDTDVVQPSPVRLARPRAPAVQGAPDLVVEILSPATAERDRGYKRAIYERHGVAEYWLVDPDGETISIYASAAACSALRTPSVEARPPLEPLLAGLTVALDDIFPSGPPAARTFP